MRTTESILRDYHTYRQEFEPIAQRYHKLNEIMSELKREYELAQRNEFTSKQRRRAQEIIDSLSTADRRLLKSLL